MPNHFTRDPELLNPDAVARVFGVTRQTLRNWRKQGKGPEYIRLPSGYIRYRRASVEALLAGEEDEQEEPCDTPAPLAA